MKAKWQLPVKESNLTNHAWIHKWAKYHYFVDGTSLCDKYWQDTEFFTTDIEQERIDKDSSLACKICLKKHYDYLE